MPEQLPTPANKFPYFISVAAAALAVAAIVISGFIFWQSHEFTRKKTAEITAMKLDLQQQHMQSEASVRSLENQLAQQLQLITRTENNLDALNQIVELGSLYQTLSEVSYFIYLANLHLLVNKDLNAAQSLLENALAALKPFNTSMLLNLKHALMADISQLKQAPTFDLTELIVQLNQLIDSVIDLGSTQQRAFKLSPSETTQRARENWHQRLEERFKKLKNLVILRHVTSEQLPALLPAQEAYIKQIIQTRLLQAEWAAMHHDQWIYHQSLGQANALLTRFFAKNAQSFLLSKQLTELTKEDVDPKLPTIDRSLSALNITLSKLKHVPSVSGSPSQKSMPPPPSPSNPPSQNGLAT